MEFENAVFSGHAVRRMFEWSIGRDEVLEVLRNGEVIADYPDDRPFPSFLLLGFPAKRALHAVAALDKQTDTCHGITAYPPDPRQWEADFRKRRKP